AQGPAPFRRGPAPHSPVTGLGNLWRRWRVPVALVAVVLLGGVVIALLKPAAMITGYADPAGTGPEGAHALAQSLSPRGTRANRVTTPAAARAAAGAGPVTLVVTSPELLSTAQLASLARVPGDRLLVSPDRAALAALAPAVRLLGPAAVRALSPGC